MMIQKNPITKGADLQKLAIKITRWVGTPTSIIIHTFLFAGAFLAYYFGIKFETVLLVLTTIVSLEAIYLSLFIQFSVNITKESLEDVEEDLGEIQEDVGALEGGFGEIQEDVEGLEGNVKKMRRNVEELEADVPVNCKATFERLIASFVAWNLNTPKVTPELPPADTEYDGLEESLVTKREPPEDIVITCP